mmetsp:Transcript_38657/g.60410  ORF Transcript_38657/g.60410 Transcript_38657/m.60410 type:complete len:484 (+) Transcript_38657:192-1643(+)
MAKQQKKTQSTGIVHTTTATSRRSAKDTDCSASIVNLEHLELGVLAQGFVQLLGPVAQPGHARRHLLIAELRCARLILQLEYRGVDTGHSVFRAPPAGAGSGPRLVQGGSGGLGQAEGLVHVGPRHLLLELEARQRLGHAEDGEQLARSHGSLVVVAPLARGRLVSLAEADVGLDEVPRQRGRHHGGEVPRLRDVRLDEGRGVGVEVERGRPPRGVHVRHVPRQRRVQLGVGPVHEQEDQVEPGQQRVRQVDVGAHRQLGVVAAVERVGGGQHGCPGVQRGGDAGLGDRDRLLLHHLVDRRPVVLVHLVELVDAADAPVGQHQGAALQAQVPRRGVAGHRRRQAHAAAALTCGVHAARRGPGDVLEQLALGHPGVPHQQHVHVPADPHAVRQLPRHPAHQHEQQGLFDVLVAVDLGGDGAGQPAVGVVAVEHLHQPPRGRLVAIGLFHELGVALLVLGHGLRQKEGVGDQARLQRLKTLVPLG